MEILCLSIFYIQYLIKATYISKLRVLFDPIVSFFIFIYFKINTEIRAIKFVPSKSKSVLNGLGIKQDDERIITEYLNSQIKSIYTWYTLENISKYTLILVFTLFCILALLLVIQY